MAADLDDSTVSHILDYLGAQQPVGPQALNIATGTGGGAVTAPVTPAATGGPGQASQSSPTQGGELGLATGAAPTQQPGATGTSPLARASEILGYVGKAGSAYNLARQIAGMGTGVSGAAPPTSDILEGAPSGAPTFDLPRGSAPAPGGSPEAVGDAADIATTLSGTEAAPGFPGGWGGALGAGLGAAYGISQAALSHPRGGAGQQAYQAGSSVASTLASTGLAAALGGGALGALGGGFAGIVAGGLLEGIGDLLFGAPESETVKQRQARLSAISVTGAYEGASETGQAIGRAGSWEELQSSLRGGPGITAGYYGVNLTMPNGQVRDVQSLSLDEMISLLQQGGSLEGHVVSQTGVEMGDAGLGEMFGNQALLLKAIQDAGGPESPGAQQYMGQIQENRQAYEAEQARLALETAQWMAQYGTQQPDQVGA